MLTPEERDELHMLLFNYEKGKLDVADIVDNVKLIMRALKEYLKS